MDDVRIKDLYLKETKSTGEIAKILGTNQIAVYRRLKLLGVLRSRIEAMKLKGAHNRITIDKEILIDLFCNKKKTILEISEILKHNRACIRRNLRYHNLYRYVHNTKDKIPCNYKGRRKIKNGYIIITILKTHKFACMLRKSCFKNTKPSGVIFEHRLVMAESLGRSLFPWEIVHHKNHIRDDNRIENLEIKYSQVEHNAETFTHTNLIELLEENKKLKLELEKYKNTTYS